MMDLDAVAPASRLDPRGDDWGVYKTLLESTKAIPWKINWATKQFDYIGPQIETLLGWPQESWTGAMDWIARIHEEDRAAVVEFCIRQSEDGVDHEADYRALRADGSFVWIRDVVHVIRDAQGRTTDLVGFMFDISERKKMEEALLEANRKLLAISRQDGLTGVGNRLLLDETLTAEWARAVRSRAPLALVMLDLDFFKEYNDHYGHLQGDHCLRQVAQAIAGIANRTTDLFSRFGGEEFALLLPETDIDAAALLAERCREAVLALALPHARSSCAPVVTISLGVAAGVPIGDALPALLIERADRLLYRAKAAGRNRVCAG